MSRASVELIDGPLPVDEPGGTVALVETAQRAGAVVVFDGVVRLTEDGKPLSGLHYESYEPMTSSMLAQLADEIIDAHGLIALKVSHSVGVVPVDCCSFRLTVWSAHRKEALKAMDEFIDRMKQEVPLWKTPRWEA